MSRLAPPSVFAATLDLLERLCAVSSPSGDVEGLTRAVRLYGDALAERGLEVGIRDEPDDAGRPLPVLDAASPDLGASPLLLVGHIDTVLPAIRPERRDGRLFATGAVDMKGGLAALVGALDLLAAENRAVPRDLRVAVVPDEEVTGALSQTVVRRLGAEARALWVLEPGQPGEGDPASAGDESKGDESKGEEIVTETAVIGRRGMLRYSLDVEGRGAHAGNGYWDGRSALLAAAEWTVAAQALTRPGRGPTVNVGRLVAGDRGFVEDLAANADLLFSTRQTNVVPDRARVEGEARYLSRGDGVLLRAELPHLADRIAENHGVGTTFRFLTDIPPVVPTGPGRALARTVSELAEKRGWRLEVEEDRRGISFPNFLEDPSSIPILDGLGPIGGGMHTREEFVDLDSLDRRIVLLADLLEAAAEDGPRTT